MKTKGGRGNGRVKTPGRRGLARVVQRPAEGALLLALLGAAACARGGRETPTRSALAAGDHEIVLRHEGRNRAYIVHVPPRPFEKPNFYVLGAIQFALLCVLATAWWLVVGDEILGILASL